MLDNLFEMELNILISGLSHITLIVNDLKRTTKFLEIVFEAREVYSSGNETLFELHTGTLEERLERYSKGK